MALVYWVDMSNAKDEAKTTKTYQAALAGLNIAQRKAVETIDGPVLVVAGPGTGKTQILTIRIAHILAQTDARPEHILALTFTDSGAQAMRDRLRQFIGADAYRVGIYTFHSFADTLIRSYPDSFARIVGGTAATEIEKISFIESIIQEGAYTLLRPVGKPLLYVRAILQQISTMKREYVTPDGLREIIAAQQTGLEAVEQYHSKGAHVGKERSEYTTLAKQIAKNQELLSVYQRYEAVLRDAGRYDFEDMILEAVQALQTDESLLQELQETYQYVLADEHQDVNESQNKILELLVSYHQRPNIFAVGDEKQAIYRFQGASLGNFLYFEDRFSDTTVIDLTDNYRSGQPILDAAQEIIQTDDETLQKLRVPLTAKAVSNASVVVQSFPHHVAEEQWLVDTVQRSIAEGVPPAEIAVMVRTNQTVEQVAHLLRAAGIAVTASADGDINQHPITEQVRSLIRAVTRPHDQMALATVLHAPYWGITAADTQRIFAARSYQRPLIEIISEPALLEEAGVKQPEKVLHVAAVLADVRNKNASLLPHRTLEVLLHDTGLLTHIHTYDALDGGRVVRRLYDTVELHVRSGEMHSLQDIERVLTQYETYGVALAAPYIPAGEGAVHVMTAHKSKGLEFAVVIAPYVTDSVWGAKVRREQFKVPLTTTSGVGEAGDDDKRLLYVVMTRAKERLYMSYAQVNTEGKEQVISRFVAPLQDLSVVACLAAEPATGQPALATSIPHSIKSNQETLFDIAHIRHVLTTRGLSATSANNYRSSPWNYFYRNVLRWPELPTLSLQYGTVVHACLERCVLTYKRTGTWATAAQIDTCIRSELERLPLTEAEYAQLHEKGLSELVVYHDVMTAQLEQSTSIDSEASFRMLLPTPAIAGIDEIPLTGSLDRVDYDASGRVIRVVDYKTGTPKSRNAIEGNTKDSTDSYKQQLRFYALLLSLSEKHHDGIAYTLSFVQPTAAGKTKEEVFYIDAAEIEETKQDIERMAAEIASGAFLSSACEAADSDYCHLLTQLVADRT